MSDWQPTRREILTGATGLVAGGAAVTAGHTSPTADTSSTETTNVQDCKTTTESEAEAENAGPIMRLDDGVEVVRHSLDRSGLWPGLNVAVKNTTDDPLRARVHARLYDSEDIRIASGTEAKRIPPGRGVEISVLFTDASLNEGSSYRMWVATL